MHAPYCLSHLVLRVKVLGYHVTEDGRFACGRCPATYKRKQHLRRHSMYECGGGRHFQCFNCLQFFRQKAHLDRHFAAQKCFKHVIKRDWCLLLLDRNITLKINFFASCISNLTFFFGFWQPITSQFVGVVSQLFGCPRCFRYYRQKYTLNRHLRYECGVKPQFKCQLCHYMGKQKISAVMHMMTVHGLPREQIHL